MQNFEKLTNGNTDIAECISVIGTTFHFQVKELQERLRNTSQKHVTVQCHLAIEEDAPTIHIAEDGSNVRDYLLEGKAGESWKGKYFHVNLYLGLDSLSKAPFMVMSGYMSDDPESYDYKEDVVYRLEVYYFNTGEKAQELQNQMRGESLKVKQMAGPGKLPTDNSRYVGFCSECGHSFTFLVSGKYYHLHSAVLYAEDGSGYIELPHNGSPRLLMGEIVERDDIRYSLDYPFRCPHCGTPYLDYEANPLLRVNGDPECILITKKGKAIPSACEQETAEQKPVPFVVLTAEEQQSQIRKKRKKELEEIQQKHMQKAL